MIAVDRIRDVDTVGNPEEIYRALYNATYDYMSKTGSWELENVFDNFVDYETAVEYLKDQIERRGLLGAAYCLNNLYHDADVYKINVYGTLKMYNTMTLQD